MNNPQYDIPVDATTIQHFSYQVAGHGALLKIGEGKVSTFRTSSLRNPSNALFQ